MRPLFKPPASSTVVFPPKLIAGGCTDNLSYSSINAILAKFPTMSGKKISTRSLRGSMVTTNRDPKYSQEYKKALARAMSHSYATSERSYNYQDVSVNVVEALSKNSTASCATTEAESCATTEAESCATTEAESNCTTTEAEVNISSGSLNLDIQPSTSTPIKVKRKLNLDDTLKNLRSKKIKVTRSDRKEEHLTLISNEIKTAIEDLRDNGQDHLLYTKTGKLCTNSVTNRISKDIVKLFPIKELRQIMESLI